MKKLAVKQLLNRMIRLQNHLQVNYTKYILLNVSNIILIILETPTSTTKRGRMGRRNRTSLTPGNLGKLHHESTPKLNYFIQYRKIK